MDFHQSASERFAEQIFKYIIKEFNGKTINSDDCNIEIMMKNLPENFDDFDLEDCLEDNQLPNINSNDENINTDVEIFKDNITPPKPKKEKKSKKEKEVPSNSENNEDKPKRKPNPYINFKKHSDNQDAIIEKSNEINEETGKRYGKVKAAGKLWKQLSAEEQLKWK